MFAYGRATWSAKRWIHHSIQTNHLTKLSMDQAFVLPMSVQMGTHKCRTEEHVVIDEDKEITGGGFCTEIARARSPKAWALHQSQSVLFQGRQILNDTGLSTVSNHYEFNVVSIVKTFDGRHGQTQPLQFGVRSKNE